MNEKKKVKDLVAQLMEQKGMSYEEWLHTQHMIFVAEHTELIREALNSVTNNKR